MKRAPAPSPSPSIAGTLFVLVLKLLWAAFVVTTPLLGAWVASSLAAYRNGPVALAAASGLLFFPALPLAWEADAQRRRRRRLKGVVRPTILTFWDRFILRTLLINLVFLGALLATYPAAGFAALSTRGDWMLEGRHGATAEAIRAQLFRAADRLEWLYLAVRPNPFDKADDGGSTSPTASTASTGGTDPVPPPKPAETAKPAPTPAPTPAPDKPPPPSAEPSREWPMSPVLHP